MAKKIARRFAELFLVDAGLSALMTALNLMQITTTPFRLAFGLSLAVAVFITVQVRMLRRWFFEIRSRKNYYIISYTAYAIFGVVNAEVYFIDSEIYTWLFSITKFLRFMPFGISNPVSAAAFHGIMVLVIILAPIGMKWVLRRNKKKKGHP